MTPVAMMIFNGDSVGDSLDTDSHSGIWDNCILMAILAAWNSASISIGLMPASA